MESARPDRRPLRSRGCRPPVFEKPTRRRTQRARRSTRAVRASSPPCPTLVKKMWDMRHGFRMHLVFGHRRRVLILERSHRIEHCASDLRYVGRAAQQRVQRCRPRNRVTPCLRALSCERRQRRLIIIDEDGAVLQQRAAVPPLGAADQLVSGGDKLSLTWFLETRAGAWGRRPLTRRRELDIRPKPAQALEEDAIDARVRLAKWRGVLQRREIGRAS